MLVHVGQIVKADTKEFNNDSNVEVIFKPIACDEPKFVTILVHVHQYPLLEVGTHWSREEKKLPAIKNKKLYKVNIDISDLLGESKPLSKHFPDFKFIDTLISEDFLPLVQNSYYTHYQFENEAVLLPSSLLLCIFYSVVA